MFIGDWMGRGALYWPEALAAVDVAKGDAGRFTYRALNARAEALGGWLREVAGVRPGARVGLVAHNGVEYLDVLFACSKIGALFVPFNWRLHAQELTELVRDTTPDVLFFGGEFRATVAQVKERTGESLRLVHLDKEALPGSTPYAEALAYRPSVRVVNEQVEAEDIFCLLFTGGTTGRSKGARISYRMAAWNALNTLVHEARAGDVTLTHTPMFHTGGLFVYTLPLLTVGGTVVIMRRWDPDELLSLVEREKVTLFFAVPTQYQQLLDSPRFRSTRFSTVRFMTSGGAPLPVPLIQAWQAVHAVPFKQGFGMTEFGPGIFSMGPEFSVSKAGSIGRPNYFIDAKLVDDGGREVPTGEVGELVLKGPSMCSGYFNDEASTREAIDAQGWFHTGDLARKDAEGFFTIAGRKKDMFISGGENVYPLELETVLYEHPAVQQCAVTGVPDAQWGEAGRAFRGAEARHGRLPGGAARAPARAGGALQGAQAGGADGAPPHFTGRQDSEAGAARGRDCLGNPTLIPCRPPAFPPDPRGVTHEEEAAVSGDGVRARIRGLRG
ncbi:long-chain fatty-acid-CoA ligase [Stigmatella aurantiaca DW4/3-1]|uniref:Long-chain fatty-acid-CoA ligase n=1 Tax=Stigmatella aurantiaca (strain DW4/3-1) TaxID=378806 RepID=Q098G4_STIAD|nr:long-chain fatty-acid-CoA ligase [Stigmatella aurantiaca DW4/3-1]